MAITESFEPSQYFNFETSFLKNEGIFKKIGFFSVESIATESKTFPYKMPCFFNCCGDSLTNLMLITVFYWFYLKVTGSLINEVVFLSLVEHLVRFEPGTF